MVVAPLLSVTLTETWGAPTLFAERLGASVKDLRITLVELPATVDGRLDGRIAKDVYSLFRYPARGVPLLEAVCRRAGYDDIVTLDPPYNRAPGRLDVDDWK